MRVFLLISFTYWAINNQLLTAQAQTPTREQLTGVWIGVHSEWDTDFSCPLPTYLQLDADSTYHLGMVDGSATKLTSTWAVHGERVRLDTIQYAPRLVSVQGSLLRIGTNYPMIFRRFSTIPIDSVSAYRQLSGRIWQSDSLTISLYANGQASLESPTGKTRTAHFWGLARFGTSVFLVIRGNQYNRNSNYKPLWQLNSLSPKQMQAIGWNGHAVATETFRLVRNLLPGESCQPSGFQTCDNCFRKMWYKSSLSGLDKRYKLNQLVAKYYQSTNQAGQSGLIRIEFVVNCEGQSGLFEMSGFGDDYCPRVFDRAITNQLQTICRDYIATDASIRITDEPGMRLQDVAVSLTFKVKDGRLIDILP